MIKLFAVCYQRFQSVASLLQSPFLLLVRLYWGWQFAQAGWGKMQHIQKVTGFFQSLGIPFPAFNAHFVAGVEFFGGLLLILGLATRLTGLILSVNMLVAYWTASRDALFSIISNPGNFYGDAAYTFLFAALLVLIFGPGWFSLDTVIARQYRQRTLQA